MGRVKLPIRRIESNTNRQVTFSKRRNGLVKKAYELSVLCDIDVALLTFSPSGRLSHFSGRRVEDVVLRYMNLPEHDRGEAIQNRERLISMLQQLKREADVATQLAKPGALNEKIEEIQQEIYCCQQQLHVSEERLRLFEPAADHATFGSTSEVDECEKFLTDVLARVVERKHYLLNNHAMSTGPAFDSTAAPGIKVDDDDAAPQVFVQAAPEQAVVEGVGTFAGDAAAALWGSMSPGYHQMMFGSSSSDPMIYLRYDQDVYDATSQVADADAWREEYTCTELLSTLIPPTTPFPLMPHCLGLGPDDQFLPTTTMEEEASASCSYVPGDVETGGGTPVMMAAAYDSAIAASAPNSAAGGADLT